MAARCIGSDSEASLTPLAPVGATAAEEYKAPFRAASAVPLRLSRLSRRASRRPRKSFSARRLPAAVAYEVLAPLLLVPPEGAVLRNEEEDDGDGSPVPLLDLVAKLGAMAGSRPLLCAAEEEPLPRGAAADDE